MKHVKCHCMNHVNVKVDLMQVFVMISSVGILIKPDVNVKKSLIKVDVMMGLNGILMHLIVNPINHVKITWIQKKSAWYGGI